MKVYKSKYDTLAGTDYSEVTKNARKEYTKVQHLTKRQPYVRSIYFGKDKVFVNVFWNHLAQKRKGEQIARARLLPAAFDLSRNTTYDPVSIFNGANPQVILHRFAGETKGGMKFCVQVKQNKRTSRKDFMSVFPVKAHK